MSRLPALSHASPSRLSYHPRHRHHHRTGQRCQHRSAWNWWVGWGSPGPPADVPQEVPPLALFLTLRGTSWKQAVSQSRLPVAGLARAQRWPVVAVGVGPPPAERRPTLATGSCWAWPSAASPISRSHSVCAVADPPDTSPWVTQRVFAAERGTCSPVTSAKAVRSV